MAFHTDAALAVLPSVSWSALKNAALIKLFSRLFIELSGKLFNGYQPELFLSDFQS